MHESDLSALNTNAASIGTLAMNLADVSRGQADLLAVGTPPSEPRFAPEIKGHPFRELINLMLMAERGSLATSPLNFEGSYAPSLLRLLTQERLLTLVEGLLFRVRPRYREETQTLATPRGRLREDSLLYSLATGTPRVASVYDELTTDTALLQVVASALRVIGSGLLPQKISALIPNLGTRAVQLLRHLSDVTLVERERALLTAEQLWIGPLDRIWAPAIEAAIPVLRDWAVVPEDGDGSTDGFLVHVSTEKFWEQSIELALKSLFSSVAVSRDGQPGEGASVPAPWARRADGHSGLRESSNSHPDYMFRTNRQVVVADAKYKLATGTSPSSSDGYQLFSYSHLATLDGVNSEIAALLYPTRPGCEPQQLEYTRMQDRLHPLWLVHLPFPTRSDIRSQGTWTSYIARLAATIASFSVEWNAQRRATLRNLDARTTDLSTLSVATTKSSLDINFPSSPVRAESAGLSQSAESAESNAGLGVER